MAYSGYLVKLKVTVGGVVSWVELPMKYIKLEGYDITPDQRMESEAKRATTGVLSRTTVAHTATKIEFNTPVITNKDAKALNDLFQSAFSSTLERKLELKYYDMETDAYKDGTFYMPDVKYSINHIDSATNTIYYNETRFAFIEY